MKAVAALAELMTAIDERRWGDLADYLHPDFRCRYSHTGEIFNADEWIRLNAEYPGFDHLKVQQLLGDEAAAACRAHVTGHGEGGLDHFECATFISMKDGLIWEMTEVWADASQQAPPETRPT